MNLSTVTLPASKTNAVRQSTFQRVTINGSPVAGVVQLDEARKPGNKVRTRRYAVTELDPSPDGRRFKLTKPLAGRRQEEDFEYVVFLPYTRGFDKCTCRAYDGQGKCSHMECLRAHARQGNVPPVEREPDGSGFVNAFGSTLRPAPAGDVSAAPTDFPNSPTINPASIDRYWHQIHGGFPSKMRGVRRPFPPVRG